MSDSHDPWKTLHAKRTQKSNKARNVTRGTYSERAPKQPSHPKTARRTPTPGLFPKKPPAPAPKPTRSPRFDPPSPSPSEPKMVFDDAPVARAVKIEPSSAKGKERFLVSVDMVTDENRQAIRTAAQAEGRTLSQWARRVLLAAAGG